MKAAKTGPPGLTTRRASARALPPFALIEQVVERPHHQDGVEGVVGEAGEVGGGSLLEACQRHAGFGGFLPRHRQQLRRQVEERDVVAALRQGDGIATGAAAAVEDAGRGWGQVFVQRAQRHRELGAVALHAQPLALRVAAVKGLDGTLDVVRYGHYDPCFQNFDRIYRMDRM